MENRNFRPGNKSFHIIMNMWGVSCGKRVGSGTFFIGSLEATGWSPRERMEKKWGKKLFKANIQTLNSKLVHTWMESANMLLRRENCGSLAHQGWKGQLLSTEKNGAYILDCPARTNFTNRSLKVLNVWLVQGQTFSVCWANHPISPLGRGSIQSRKRKPECGSSIYKLGLKEEPTRWNFNLLRLVSTLCICRGRVKNTQESEKILS